MKRSKTLSLELEADVALLSTEEGEAGAGDQAIEDDPTNPFSLVGDVLESGSVDLPGRILVRWRAADGVLTQGWLYAVRGLLLKKGDLVLLQRPGNWSAWLITHAIGNSTDSDAQDEPVKRIEIEGQDEVVLRCGKASITLRRNGRVIIRGKYVESRSEGTNRIKGGTVLIN